MAKFLVINPNSSAFVTQKCVDAARDTLGVDADVVGITSTDGPAIIGTREECRWAEGEALRLGIRHAHGCDGVLLAISFDTGLIDLRRRLSIPVVGISEAGMLMAMASAREFALLTFGETAVPIYRDLVTGYGFDSRCTGVLSLPALSDAEKRRPELLRRAMASKISEAAGRGAGAVVLAGAIFAGMTTTLRDHVPVPVIDGVAAGSLMLSNLATSTRRDPVDETEIRYD